MFTTDRTSECTIGYADQGRGHRFGRSTGLTPGRELMPRLRSSGSSAVSCAACGLTVRGRRCPVCRRGHYVPVACPGCGCGLRGSRGCSDCGAPASS